MAEKKKDVTIPQSVIIADVRNKLNEIIQHTPLSPPIIELVLKEAWMSAAFKAQTQLTYDYNAYVEETKEREEQTENGI